MTDTCHWSPWHALTWQADVLLARCGLAQPSSAPSPCRGTCCTWHGAPWSQRTGSHIHRNYLSPPCLVSCRGHRLPQPFLATHISRTRMGFFHSLMLPGIWDGLAMPTCGPESHVCPQGCSAWGYPLLLLLCPHPLTFSPLGPWEHLVSPLFFTCPPLSQQGECLGPLGTYR